MKTSATYISTKNIYFNLRCIYFELGNLLKAISFITSIFSMGLYEGSRKTFNH
jgi:hypothetical protein